MCGRDDGAEGEDGEDREGRQGALRTEGQRGELTGEPQQQRGVCPCHTSVAYMAQNFIYVRLFYVRLFYVRLFYVPFVLRTIYFTIYQLPNTMADGCL